MDFESVVHGEVSRLLAIAHGVLDDAAAAEDAVQEALVLAWRRWDDLRDPSRRRAWLTRIVVRHCVRMRRLGRHRPLPVEQEEAAVTPPAGDRRWLGWDHVWGLLSRNQRAVISLHYQYGFTLDESASLIGCRPGTARRHLARALDRLRKEAVDD